VSPASLGSGPFGRRARPYGPYRGLDVTTGDTTFSPTSDHVGPAYAKRKGADVRAVAQCFPGPSGAPPLFGVWVAAPCVLSAPSTCHEHDTLRWAGKQSGNDYNRRDSPSLRPPEPRAALIYAACRSRGSGPSPTILIAASARAEGYSAVPRVHGHFPAINRGVTTSSDANLVVRRRFQWLSVPEWATRASSPPQSAGPISPLSATRPQLPKRGK